MRQTKSRAISVLGVYSPLGFPGGVLATCSYCNGSDQSPWISACTLFFESRFNTASHPPRKRKKNSLSSRSTWSHAFLSLLNGVFSFLLLRRKRTLNNYTCLTIRTNKKSSFFSPSKWPSTRLYCSERICGVRLTPWPNLFHFNS